MHALPDREVQSKISRRNGAQMLSPQHGISAYWGTLGRAFRNPVLGRAADSFDRTAWLAGSLSPLSARLDGKNSLCAVETRRKCPLTAGFSNAFFESLVSPEGHTADFGPQSLQQKIPFLAPKRCGAEKLRL